MNNFFFSSSFYACGSEKQEMMRYIEREMRIVYMHEMCVCVYGLVLICIFCVFIYKLVFGANLLVLCVCVCVCIFKVIVMIVFALSLSLSSLVSFALTNYYTTCRRVILFYFLKFQTLYRVIANTNKSD